MILKTFLNACIISLALIPLVGAAAFASDQLNPPRITILCYHTFSAGPPTNPYMISVEVFNRQLAYLQQKQYQVISLDYALDLINGKIPYPPGQQFVVITVDDAHRSFYELAYPVMKRYGYTATLFVPTMSVGPAKKCMHWGELEQLQKEGYLIGSHTLDHSRLFEKRADPFSPQYQTWLRKELKKSKATIEKRLGIKVRHFAHPYGIYTWQVVEVIKEAGYESAATVNEGNNAPGDDPFRLKRTMVLSSHTFHDYSQILENNPLTLKTCEPADGAIVSGKNITLCVQLPSLPAGFHKVRFFLSHTEHKGFKLHDGFLEYTPSHRLAQGPYIAEIIAEDEKGTPWIGSWLFYVQEPKNIAAAKTKSKSKGM